MITQSRLKELLNYDADTGEFVWKVARQRIKAGCVAGSLDKSGYRRITIDKNQFWCHRLAWFYVFGMWPKDQIDHINGVHNDNWIANLREATSAQNKQNLRKPHADSKFGLLGVHFSKGRFKARIQLDGGNRYLGSYETPEQAHAAYLTAKRNLHEFGTL